MNQLIRSPVVRNTLPWMSAAVDADRESSLASATASTASNARISGDVDPALQKQNAIAWSAALREMQSAGTPSAVRSPRLTGTNPTDKQAQMIKPCLNALQIHISNLGGQGQPAPAPMSKAAKKRLRQAQAAGQGAQGRPAGSA